MILVGGSQYKPGTDLWAQDAKGLLAAPDFGKIMSKDRFERILRYWARGPLGVEDKLGEEPWAEVEWWVDGHNRVRTRWLRAGSLLTPDEIMMAWTGHSGPGGIPHLSFVKRKPQPLGAELKAVCDGSTGVCMFVEMQEGKERMRRKAFVEEYGATTACTVRMLNQMGMAETNLETKLKRVVTADSWFASLKTANAVKSILGMEFTGMTFHEKDLLDSCNNFYHYVLILIVMLYLSHSIVQYFYLMKLTVHFMELTVHPPQ